ncbi:MAG: RHS repeat-associated protein [Bacteroidia bacterium]|jgi:RHS repeat-associated protein
MLISLLCYDRYHPFGMQIAERTQSFATNGYRYGFNGQEKDDEVAGKGNSMTAEFWQYDSRLGRRWNLDPKPNLSMSYYACFANSPISYIDQLGDTIVYPNETAWGGSRREGGFKPNAAFAFGFQADLNRLYSTSAGKSMIRTLQSSTVLIEVKDASRWYLNDQEDVENSNALGDQGDAYNYYEASLGWVTVNYAQRPDFLYNGVVQTSYLVLGHQFQHAKDIANGYFTNLIAMALSGEIDIPDLDFSTEIAEVRAILFENAIRSEMDLPLKTSYKADGIVYTLLNPDGTPIKEYGFDITEGVDGYTNGKLSTTPD